MHTPIVRWISVTEFAVAHNFGVDEVITRIHRGNLNGVVIGARWYVLDELVSLHIPDRSHPERATLWIAATRDGPHLKAGCDTTVELNLVYDDTIRTAVGKLFGPANVRPDRPIDITLGTDTWIIDPSLQGELLGALLEWQVEVELGDLLVQYAPRPAN